MANSVHLQCLSDQILTHHLLDGPGKVGYLTIKIMKTLNRVAEIEITRKMERTLKMVEIDPPLHALVPVVVVRIAHKVLEALTVEVDLIEALIVIGEDQFHANQEGVIAALLLQRETADQSLKVIHTVLPDLVHVAETVAQIVDAAVDLSQIAYPVVVQMISQLEEIATVLNALDHQLVNDFQVLVMILMIVLETEEVVAEEWIHSVLTEIVLQGIHTSHAILVEEDLSKSVLKNAGLAVVVDRLL
jgi:hypothetical protein